MYCWWKCKMVRDDGKQFGDSSKIKNKITF
jgi:hypothetical protein